MRHIDRSAEPSVLTRNGARWLSKFKASGSDRPDNKQYAHKEIRDYLKNMSSGKCFYCEHSLKCTPSEVDHHVEISVNKDKAFEWNNLYLSCKRCNHKLNEFNIPSSETLDPCNSSDAEIQQHITYNREQIMPVGISERGQKTIRKYHLDRDELDFLRIKQLRKVDEAIEEVDMAMINDCRNRMTTDEKNKLLSFTVSSQPFSYMCEVYLKMKRPAAFV